MKTLLPVLLFCLPLVAQVPPPPMPMPTEPIASVGRPAPKFRLNDDTGTMTDYGGPSKSWTVLAFYPKAATPG